jgi:hypothetical protein
MTPINPVSQETFEFTKAVRRRSKIRIAIAGPSGSGKTYSALMLAKGLGGTIGLIDTEFQSAPLYSHLTDFDCVSLRPPYSPERYIKAIKAAEQAGYDNLIIDSFSHAWSGSGGILDMHSMEELKQKNGFRAWREVTPKHNELVDTILQAPMNIIVTMRSKQDWVNEKDADGKWNVKKVGLAPVQREGVEYEFTLVFDVDHATHKATVSKTRIDGFDKRVEVITEQMGRDIMGWMEEGAEVEKVPAQIRQIVR